MIEIQIVNHEMSALSALSALFRGKNKIILKKNICTKMGGQSGQKDVNPHYHWAEGPF